MGAELGAAAPESGKPTTAPGRIGRRQRRVERRRHETPSLALLRRDPRFPFIANAVKRSPLPLAAGWGWTSPASIALPLRTKRERTRMLGAGCWILLRIRGRLSRRPVFVPRWYWRRQNRRLQRVDFRAAASRTARPAR
jgi:hypothetical protein